MGSWGTVTFQWTHGIYPVVNYGFWSAPIGFKITYLAIISLYFKISSKLCELILPEIYLAEDDIIFVQIR